MKKIILFVTLLLLLTACSDKSNINKQDDKDEVTNLDTYTDTNPIKVGLYENNSLVNTYQANFNTNQDLASFYVYYTNDKTIEKTTDKATWQKYYDKYTDIDNYKIGFEISFETENETMSQTIIDATSTHSMGPYLYVYLYDDINQPDNTFYSHLETINDDTIISSIKLYLASAGDEITSPITLTVFTYDSDDFDASGKYRGNSKYTIEIENR